MATKAELEVAKKSDDPEKVKAAEKYEEKLNELAGKVSDAASEFSSKATSEEDSSSELGKLKQSIADYEARMISPWWPPIDPTTITGHGSVGPGAAGHIFVGPPDHEGIVELGGEIVDAELSGHASIATILTTPTVQPLSEEETTEETTEETEENAEEEETESETATPTTRRRGRRR